MACRKIRLQLVHIVLRVDVRLQPATLVGFRRTDASERGRFVNRVYRFPKMHLSQLFVVTVTYSFDKLA